MQPRSKLLRHIQPIWGAQAVQLFARVMVEKYQVTYVTKTTWMKGSRAYEVGLRFTVSTSFRSADIADL